MILCSHDRPIRECVTCAPNVASTLSPRPYDGHDLYVAEDHLDCLLVAARVYHDDDVLLDAVAYADEHMIPVPEPARANVAHLGYGRA